MMNMIKKKHLVTILALAIAAFLLILPGCEIIKEGITGERQREGELLDVQEDIPSLPPAFSITGEWFGVYSGNEYLEFVFTADLKCELQPAVYPSDIYGPRYYGDYRWGGETGNEIFLDLYMGVSREVDYGGGNIWDEWSDGGRGQANTALTMSLQVFGGNMRSLALKAVSPGVDTQGYTVVHTNAFMVLVPLGNPTPFVYGSVPYDLTEGKRNTPSAPDLFASRAERQYTTAELNVRCGPSTSFGTYGTVPPGTPVDKIAAATNIDDWAFVLLDSGGGWCNTEYLSVNPPAFSGGNDGGNDGGAADAGDGDDDDEEGGE